MQPLPATPAWPPRSAPRLFVETPLTAGADIVIDGNAAHYLGSVMRAKPGDIVVLCDDVTGEWAARVDAVTRRAVMLRVETLLRPREPLPDLWLCAALIKKNHFDLILEKATELGVAHILPVVTRRCVVDKLNLERARAITTEAAEQCARTALPTIAAPVALVQLLRAWPADRALFMADELSGGAAGVQFAATSGPAALLTGPEGGFDDAERAMLHAHPAVRVIGLGPRILRAETAAIAMTTLWMSQQGDWSDDPRAG